MAWYLMSKLPEKKLSGGSIISSLEVLNESEARISDPKRKRGSH